MYVVSGGSAYQEQLIDAAKDVAHSVEGIVEAAQQSCRDDKLLADLAAAATGVTQALNDLLQHIKKGAGPTAAGESHEDAVDMILTVTDRLFSSVGDAHEMVRQARQLAQRPLHWLGPSGEKPRVTLTRTCRSGSWPPPDNSLMPPRTWWKLPRAVRRVRTTRSSRRDYEALQRISGLPQILLPATPSKRNSSGG
nr:talin-1-like [Crassostrea gigas]